MSYTDEEAKMVVAEYSSNPTPETVLKLALLLKRSKKSIIGKLSREGVYRREIYKSKTGEIPITKKEILENIAEMFNVDMEDLDGLDKSPKKTLKTLEKLIAGSQQA